MERGGADEARAGHLAVPPNSVEGTLSLHDALMTSPGIRPRAGPVVVRRLRAGDVDVCAGIVAADPLWERYGVTFRSARYAIGREFRAGRRRGMAAREAAELAVAHHGGRVVGFIWFYLRGTFHHSGYVRWVAVAPQAQGRGVGRRLMQYAEDRIFRAGPNVFLMVADFNEQAQRFYEALGYRLVGKVPDYILPGIGEHVYRKTRGAIASRRRRVRRTVSANVPR